MSPGEKVIENAILVFLNYLPGCFAWKNNSMGVYDPVKKTYRKSKNKHAINGVADILGVYDGRMLAIEVKSARGKPSKDQENFLARINKLGGIAGVARSIQDVRDILNRGEGNETKEVSE